MRLSLLVLDYFSFEVKAEGYSRNEELAFIGYLKSATQPILWQLPVLFHLLKRRNRRVKGIS